MPTQTPTSPKDIAGRKDISLVREITLTRLGLIITAVATVMLLLHVSQQIIQNISAQNSLGLAEQILFGTVALAMIYGNLVYQFTRAGYMKRLQSHKPASAHDLAPLFNNPPSLTILVPSYKEDPDVVRRTLLSAALQNYPQKRVVLLIDDPAPKTESDRTLLASAQQLPHDIQSLLAAPRAEFSALLDSFRDRQNDNDLNLFSETLALANAHATAATWYQKQAATHTTHSHSDAFFIQQTFREPAHFHHQRAKQLHAAAKDAGPYLSPEEILADYQSLAAPFQTTLSSFQRKKFLNLSHEANKAMNLNSYITLLGKRYIEIQTGAGRLLEPCPENTRPTLSVPASDYLITLDADSTIAPDYALRLIHFAEQPANQKVAVVQTPYSAEPNPPGHVERIAGATTDLQYLLHQGFTHFNATFWVGANALLRTSALNDIVTTEIERGYSVQRFIQDRTVIEDTESSVDLASKGWKLYNYPQRLSHSATPADFGSLLIQRRRWANGGLIIFPKLLRYIFAGPENPAQHTPNFPARCREGFFRLHYLISIALVNLALPIMLLFPFENNLKSIWFPLTCVPYYFLYGRDLVQAGYKISDLLRVYAMNLLLVPVNLGGVFTSIHQGIAKHKIPFKRTPKVGNRTAAPAAYILIAYAMVLYCVVNVIIDILSARYFHASFNALNAIFLTYALLAFVGIKNAAEDITLEFPALKNLLGEKPVDRYAARCQAWWTRVTATEPAPQRNPNQ
jgi:cellulose synthase/poly-beta-1,6-N-acetylglucosamine synthase-like glycosyltransferase